MVASSSMLAALASLFATQAFGAAVPAAAVEQLAPRDASGPTTSCFNTWEKVTVDPSVQYWYVVAGNTGNSLKADRIWNHLNLNGCAVTENKYHANPEINGSSITFHASAACTAYRVTEAIRQGSEPAVHIDCQYTGNGFSGDPFVTASSGLSAAGEAALEFLKDL